MFRVDGRGFPLISARPRRHPPPASPREDHPRASPRIQTRPPFCRSTASPRPLKFPPQHHLVDRFEQARPKPRVQLVRSVNNLPGNIIDLPRRLPPSFPRLRAPRELLQTVQKLVVTSSELVHAVAESRRRKDLFRMDGRDFPLISARRRQYPPPTSRRESHPRNASPSIQISSISLATPPSLLSAAPRLRVSPSHRPSAIAFHGLDDHAELGGVLSAEIEHRPVRSR